MAISTSPDCPLACINCSKAVINKQPSFTVYYSCKILPLFLCFNSPSAKKSTLIARSSSCSSPSAAAIVLENADSPSSSSSTAPAASTAVIDFDLHLEDLRPSSKSLQLPETEDLNALICSLFRDRKTEGLACDYYEKAKERRGFRPEKLTLRLLIRYLTRAKKWSFIFSLPDDFESYQVLPDSVTCYRLITICIRARKFRLVNRLLRVFVSDRETAVLAFDSAMKGYNKIHMYRITIDLFKRMKSAGVALDSGCYCSVVEAYLKIGKYEKVDEIFQEFKKTDTGCRPCYTPIYRMLCESLGRLGRPFEALEYFREMTAKGIPGDHSFYSTLIGSFASIGEIWMVEELLKEAEMNNMLRDPALFLKLVLMYIDKGMVEKTLDIVAVMNRIKIRVSDCISCAIVNGFSKRRGLKAAVKAYEDLLAQGCEPGQVTFASVINVYCRLEMFSEAEGLFSEMLQKGYDKCVVAYSNMIAMYGKTGRTEDAMKLVARMKEKGCEPNVWVYNALLDMHGRAQNLRQVDKIWKEMNRRKVWRDKVSYTSIISAYSRTKDFEKCMRYYQEFRLNGGTIDRAMAGIMVGVFSKMNRIDELLKLLQDMKKEGTPLDTRICRSALNAMKDSGLGVPADWLQESFDAT